MDLAAVLVLLLLLPAGGPSDETVLEQARAHRRAGRLDAAITVLEAADQTDPQVAGMLGLCLLDDGRLEQARALAAQREGDDGGDYRLAVFLGRLALQEGDHEQAVVHLEAATDRKDRPIEALVALVDALGRADRTVQAAKVAERLEQHQPELGRQLGARMLAAAGDRIAKRTARNFEAMPRAYEMYKRAHEKAPDDRAIAIKLMNTAVNMHRIDEAIALVEMLYPQQTHPDEHDLQLGRCRHAAGDVAAAEKLFRAVLGRHPDHRDATLELGRLLLDRGDLDPAAVLLAPCAERHPDVARAQRLLGLVEEARGDFTRAELYLRRAVALEPAHAETLYHLGRVLVRTGKADEGREYLARFREMGRDG